MGFQTVPQWTTGYSRLDFNVGFLPQLCRHHLAPVLLRQAFVDSVLAAICPTPRFNIRIMAIFPILY